MDFLLRRFSLTLTRDGFGSGFIIASGSRTLPNWRHAIKCRTRSCTLSDVPYGAKFTIRPLANPGSAFLHWAGACAAQRPLCTLTIAQDTSVNGTFVRSLSARP
jgi:hypothetical protein